MCYNIISTIQKSSSKKIKMVPCGLGHAQVTLGFNCVSERTKASVMTIDIQDIYVYGYDC